jgi:hypothetical protein
MSLIVFLVMMHNGLHICEQQNSCNTAALKYMHVCEVCEDMHTEVSVVWWSVLFKKLLTRWHVLVVISDCLVQLGAHCLTQETAAERNKLVET